MDADPPQLSSTSIAAKKTIARVQQLLSGHGATVEMVEDAEGEPTAVKFTLVVDDAEPSSGVSVDTKAVLTVMHHDPAHVGGWKPGPGLLQISPPTRRAAPIPLGANRSSLLEARRPLPGHDGTGSAADGAPCRPPPGHDPSTVAVSDSGPLTVPPSLWAIASDQSSRVDERIVIRLDRSRQPMRR
jgi:hypothetical protein